MTRLLAALLLLCVTALGQDYLKNPEVHNLPDAPGKQTTEVRFDPSTGQYVEYPKVKVFDKWFFLTHGALLAANVFDIETSVRGKCFEGGDGEVGTEKPTRGELYGKDMTVFAVVLGMDAVVKKWLPGGKWISLGPPIYGAAVHVRGGIKWHTTPGCL